MGDRYKWPPGGYGAAQGGDDTDDTTFFFWAVGLYFWVDVFMTA